MEIEQQWSGGGGVGSAVWLASIWLATYLERGNLTQKRVVELGAGCGGLGSIAALRAGATVVATDGDDEIIDLLDRNVRSACAECNYRGAIPLRWGESLEPVLERLGGPADLVLAADIVYPATKRFWPAFFDTLRELDAPCLLSHARRYQDLDQAFFALAETSGFEAHPVDAAPPGAIFRLVRRTIVHS